MLKKKILGAKVLDTNGFVQATRLITPNNAGKNHQLGDIYSANAIDEKISQIEIGDNTDISELKVAIAENKTAISDEKIRAQQQETSINELVQLINQQLQHAIKGIKLEVTKYSDSGDEATLVLSRGGFDVNNDKPVTSTVKLDFSQATNRANKAADAANKAALDARQLIETTYAALKALRYRGELVPGRMYRITDYATTATQADTRPAGHPFDIIVTADSATKLNERAHAIQHDGDTYFAKSNLQAWQVWYTLDNDTTLYAWADAANGKGVIYRLIDEFGNDCPYDFKNIQFKRYQITSTTKESMKGLVNGYYGMKDVDSSSMMPQDCTIGTTDALWCYTFRSGVGGDLSLDGKACHHNIVSAYRSTSSPYSTALNNIVLRNETDQPRCHSNRFAPQCRNITAGSGFYGNTFGNDCYYNTFGNDCDRNTFGNYCYYNTFGNNCDRNTFGNYCYYNTFGNNCYGNTFGNSCYGNTFGNDCDINTFGNDCDRNTFGNSCYRNTFGNDCDINTFGNDCDRNTFGNSCYRNTFGEVNTGNTDSSGGAYTLPDGSSYFKGIDVMTDYEDGDTDDNNMMDETANLTLTSPFDIQLTATVNFINNDKTLQTVTKTVDLKANVAQEVDFVANVNSGDFDILEFMYEYTQRGTTIKFHNTYDW